MTRPDDHTPGASAEGLPASAEPGVREDQDRIDRAWLRIGAGLVVAAQAMVFTLAINVEEIEGAWVRWTLHGLLFASALGSLVFLGQDLLTEAWKALRSRRVTIDLLFLVTLLGALAGSILNSVRGVGSVYYEVVAILIVVHTAGRMLAARSRVAALEAVAKARRAFAYCRRMETCGDRHVPVTALVAGERVRVLPGEAIPVDGVILAGRSYVQETAITGEWKPQPKGPGDTVWAGSHAVDGEIEVEVKGGERRLDQVLAAVESAKLAPSRVQTQADRLTTLFLPVVIGVALATGVFWWLRGPWDQAVFNSMAVLLVACPCAMGLATPVAIWGALARLSRWGVVARTGDFVAGLAEVDGVVFDKTGTLSTDKLRILGWHYAPDWQGRALWLAEAVAAVESGLKHPIARALSLAHPKPSEPARERTLIPGQGVEALWQGRRLLIGEPSLGAGAPVTVAEGKTVHVFVGGAWAATLTLGEEWREGLAEAREALSALGIEAEVLSGDPAAVQALGDSWKVRGGMTPEDKLEHVRALRARGRKILFVGDGVNDAAALSAADVAIALQSGTELAQASAAAVFSGTDLRFLPQAVRLARATMRGVRRNLFFSFAYNVAGMALAASGHLHPVVAALLMVGSSAIVSIQALQSSRITGAGERALP